MALTFTIGGVDKTALVAVSTLAVTDTLNSRNTASFTLNDLAGTYLPVIGTSVIILNGAIRVFAGTIDDFTSSDLTPETGAGIQHSIDCVDWNQIADRFNVAKAYATVNQTLFDIVTDIVATAGGIGLAVDGVTMSSSTVALGPLIQSAVWNYLPASTAFDDLADLAGYSWWIDYSKVLWFQPRSGITAPFALTDTSSNFRKIQVKRSRTDYRNYQIVRAGTDLTASRTEHFPGDGKSRSFPVVYSVGQAPTAITLNAVAKTIGILNIDTGKDFYYQVGSPLISQDSGGTLLVSTDDVAITYQGQFPIIIVAQEDGEITTRKGIEAGSGIYQETEYYPNVNGTATTSGTTTAQNIANGLLQKFGKIPVIIDFETDSDGLFSGQLIPITNAKYGLAGTYLVSKVTFADFTGTGKLRYQVEVYDGQFLGGWETFFRNIAAFGKTYVIRQDEVVTYVRTAGTLTGVGVNASDSLTAGWTDPANANVGAHDSLATPATMAPESRADFALTDLSETG